MPLLVLLPPSEGKRPGGRGRWSPGSGRFGRSLGGLRREVCGALAAAMDDDATARRITGLAGARHEAAVAANRGAAGGPALPAWQRYSGVVWEHLEPDTLAGAALERAEGVVVVSPLGGLFALHDPVPDHKLKMAAGLAATGQLARFWAPALGGALRRAAAGAAVVDLLPDEHRRALPPDFPAVRVEFRTPTGRAAGHAAKAAKGRFARHLLEVGDVEEAAATFRWEGWRGRPGPDGVVIAAAGAGAGC